MLRDQCTVNRTRERRPAAARIVFIRRDEERLTCRDIAIDALTEFMVVLVEERSLGRLLLRNGVLQIRQACLEFGIRRLRVGAR